MAQLLGTRQDHPLSWGLYKQRKTMASLDPSLPNEIESTSTVPNNYDKNKPQGAFFIFMSWVCAEWPVPAYVLLSSAEFFRLSEKSHVPLLALLGDLSRWRPLVPTAFQSPSKRVLCPLAWGTCSRVTWNPPSLLSTLFGECLWLPPSSVSRIYTLFPFLSVFFALWGLGER